MVALAEGHVEVVEVLLTKGADHSYTDKVSYSTVSEALPLLFQRHTEFGIYEAR